MSELSRRTLAVIAALPALSLAACGSPAINTHYTPGPSTAAPSAMTSTPKPHASASHHASATATKAATHHATVAASTATHASQPIPKPPTHTTLTHTVAPTSAVITVTPSTVLADGQTVTIRGAHFKPGVSIIIVECVDHGANTQDTNCTGNGGLLGIPSGFTPGADGTFTKTFVVHKSFSGIGGGYNTCTASTPCIISVTEPTNNPTEEADAPIRFS